MNAYPKMKDSGVEWIGDIPENWEIEPVKFHVKINQKVIPENTSPNFKISYIDISSVHSDGTIDTPETLFFEDAPSRARRIISKGDTIVSTVRTYLKAISFIEQKNGSLICSTGFAVVSPESRIYPKFLYYMISSEGYVNTIMANSFGVAYPAIKSSMIGRFPCVLLPLDEQKLIVEFLDKETSKIKSEIQRKQKLIELLKEKRQAIINQTVTKGLDPTVPMKDSEVEWIGDIPEGWKIRRLKFISRYDLSSVDRHQNEGELQVLVCHYPEVYNNEKITKTTVLSGGTCNPKEYEKFRLKKDDVLITKDSETPDDIGVPAYVADDITNAVCGYHLAQLSTDKNQLLGSYLFRLLQSSFANAYFEICANGVTRFGLGKDSIGSIMVPLPSLIEQESIHKFLDMETSKINNLIQKTEIQMEKLQEYRQVIISDLITGKIDVRYA